MALTEPRRTEYLLRKSTTRAPIAHGIVSGVECAGQLWLRFEEKETQKRPIARGFGRYNSLLCAFYSFFNLWTTKEKKMKELFSFPSLGAFSFGAFKEFFSLLFIISCLVYLWFSCFYFLRKMMKKKKSLLDACGKNHWICIQKWDENFASFD